jgi:GNAT superfamily N-acetyltransferase
MANIDTLLPVDVSEHHIGDAMALVKEAGWNQCARDWRMMLAAGKAFGFEDGNGKLIASALILPYGARIGWISMVLVSAAYQRRGLATRLIDRAVLLLEKAGLTPCLDATPAGEQVYKRRGFLEVFSFHRWHRPGAETDFGPSQPLNATDIVTVQRLDEAAFGGDRGPLLADVAQRGAPCEVINDGRAFALSRAGRVAHQIGPIVAQDETTAVTLFGRLLDRIQTTAFIDIPDEHNALADCAEAAGFTRQRPFKRMIRSSDRRQGPGAMFALFGPELG